VSSTPGHALLG